MRSLSDSLTASNPLSIFEPIEAGQLIARLAQGEHELELAQRLRFRIFCDELGAKANAEVMAQKRDFDEFDAVCDHMLVIDREKQGDDAVVGTYRLLTGKNSKKIGRFYSQSEFDITPLLEFDGEIMELGRSCVNEEYRSRATMQLLWRGIGAYVSAHDVKILFGCASLYGVDIEAHRAALAYLYHYHLAPPALRVRALSDQYVEMNTMPKESFDAKKILMTLPPLVKGYLRLGSFVGEGAVVDYAYNTTDVGIVVNTDLITDKYAQRYQPDAE